MGVMVICSYKPNAGQSPALQALVAEHVPTLRRLGLATDTPHLAMQGEGGAVVEVFEWVSESASRAAHDHPEVARIWGEFAQICEFVPLAAIGEAQKPFAHFKPIGTGPSAG